MVVLTTSSAMPASELAGTDIATADAVGAMFGVRLKLSRMHHVVA